MTTRIAAGLLFAALAFPSAAAQADNPKLVAVVGTNDAFVISLRDASGNLVSHLDPGTYDIAVSDRSEMHDFHLRGPGVDDVTPIEAKQDVTWTVNLTDGRYSFVCDPHSTQMRGFFTVGTLPPTTISASVGPRKTISLRPKTADVGPATITVNDRSRRDNFHLTGPGVNRKTGVATRSRVTWSVTLQPGRYTYRSDKTKKLRGSFTVRFPA
jgi:Copper binding proteins, plastocyanin/azurin family